MKFDLKTRDFINIGIFAVIYFLLVYLSGMIGFFGPWFMFVGFTIAIILNGIVIVLFLIRTPKMGAMTLLGFIHALLFVIAGQVWYLLVIVPVLGFIADLIIHIGVENNELKRSRLSIAYALFSLWYNVPLFPVIYNAEAYYDEIRPMMRDDYVNSMQAILTGPFLATWAVTIFILGLIGGWLGILTAKKHFQPAGLAS
ncbi:MAG: MptD family putative ECF transporter S component [Actinomycetaceae bacterium]|nr:MptD family putative ECF transporter S component [Actinomycetaceae bacterium]